MLDSTITLTTTPSTTTSTTTSSTFITTTTTTTTNSTTSTTTTNSTSTTPACPAHRDPPRKPITNLLPLPHPISLNSLYPVASRTPPSLIDYPPTQQQRALTDHRLDVRNITAFRKARAHLAYQDKAVSSLCSKVAKFKRDVIAYRKWALRNPEAHSINSPILVNSFLYYNTTPNDDEPPIDWQDDTLSLNPSRNTTTENTLTNKMWTRALLHEKVSLLITKTNALNQKLADAIYTAQHFADFLSSPTFLLPNAPPPLSKKTA